MNNENTEKKDLNAEFDDAVAEVKKLRGGVDAYVVLAIATEKDEDGGFDGITAMGGKGADIMRLMNSAHRDIFRNIIMSGCGDIVRDILKDVLANTDGQEIKTQTEEK